MCLNRNHLFTASHMCCLYILELKIAEISSTGVGVFSPTVDVSKLQKPEVL